MGSSTYRDREENLRRLLFHLIPLLKRQGIAHYDVHLVEQGADGPFNKGRLYNAAFSYLMRTSQPNCLIFHGKQLLPLVFFSLSLSPSAVDLIPEDPANLDSCSSHADHPIDMSAQVRSHLDGSSSHIYPFLIGGEDDDLDLRFFAKGICVQRPSSGSCYAASHSTQKHNEQRFQLLFDAVLEQDVDGLNTIDRLTQAVHVRRYPLVNWITEVDRFDPKPQSSSDLLFTSRSYRYSSIDTDLHGSSRS
jgi:hypothetical protein